MSEMLKFVCAEVKAEHAKELNQALDWALKQNYSSVAARYAKILAEAIDGKVLVELLDGGVALVSKANGQYTVKIGKPQMDENGLARSGEEKTCNIIRKKRQCYGENTIMFPYCGNCQKAVLDCEANYCCWCGYAFDKEADNG